MLCGAIAGLLWAAQAALSVEIEDCLAEPLVTTQILCLSAGAEAAQDIGVCLRSTDQAVRWHCAARYAEAAEDPNLCERLVAEEEEPFGLSRDLCRVELAIAWERPDLCQGLNTAHLGDSCLLHIVENGGDPALCDRIENETLREACGPAE